MHGDVSAHELCVQRVRIIRVDVGVPASPFVARTIGMGMDFRCDGLNHECHSVASNDGKEVASLAVTSALIANVEPQLGLIKSKRCAQIIDNKKGSNTVQHSEAPEYSNIAFVGQPVQLATG